MPKTPFPRYWQHESTHSFYVEGQKPKLVRLGYVIDGFEWFKAYMWPERWIGNHKKKDDAMDAVVLQAPPGEDR